MNRVDDSFFTLTQQFRTRVQAIYGSRLKAVFVFGSYARARGDAQAESDVDFLIVLDQFDRYGEEVDRISPIVSDLSLAHGVSISDVFVSERDWLTHQTPFLNNVRSAAIPI